MITDRANAICLLEILKEYSDEEHILPMREILSKMNLIYGIKPDRRTIYSAAALLIDLGYDISVYEENGVGYYLRSRDLEQSEVLLLMDAVYSFPFLPTSQSEKLIEKLQKNLSVHQRKQYRHLLIVRSDHKTDNRQVFWNIECLDEAIAQKKQVQFLYLEYGMDKKMHPRSEKPYTVNPYGMVYMNEHYYLICNRHGFPGTSLYRIDRMQDIVMLDKTVDRSGELRDHTVDAVYAFSGTPERITMHCRKMILNDIIDKFGIGVQLRECDENTVTVSFTAPPYGVQFWALQYLPYAEVTEPLWLREKIIESIQRNPYETKEYKEFNCYS